MKKILVSLLSLLSFYSVAQKSFYFRPTLDTKLYSTSTQNRFIENSYQNQYIELKSNSLTANYWLNIGFDFGMISENQKHLFEIGWVQDASLTSYSFKYFNYTNQNGIETYTPCSTTGFQLFMLNQRFRFQYFNLIIDSKNMKSHLSLGTGLIWSPGALGEVLQIKEETGSFDYLAPICIY